MFKPDLCDAVPSLCGRKRQHKFSLTILVKLPPSPSFAVRSDTTSECEYLREREAIRAKHSRRKEENQLKRDEIRKKYGML